MEELEIIGSRLRDLRIAKGDSLGDVSRVTGITKSILSKYERGLVDPGLRTVKKLMVYYGSSVDWLLDFDKEKKSTVSQDPFRGLTDEEKENAIGYIQFLNQKKELVKR